MDTKHRLGHFWPILPSQAASLLAFETCQTRLTRARSFPEDRKGVRNAHDPERLAAFPPLTEVGGLAAIVTRPRFRVKRFFSYFLNFLLSQCFLSKPPRLLN